MRAINNNGIFSQFVNFLIALNHRQQTFTSIQRSFRVNKSEQHTDNLSKITKKKQDEKLQLKLKLL